ncbi:MAG: MMPL family transporter [Planctomycetota bacterium]
MLDRWRHELLGRWSRVVAYHPWRVLLISLLLAALGVVYAATNLGFQSNRNDLISPEMDWNQRFIAWQSHFPGNADLLVVIDTHRDRGGRGEEVYAAADVAGARRLADAMGARLGALETVERVSWKVGVEEGSGRAVRLLDGAEFDEAAAGLAQAGPVLASATVAELLDAALAEAGRALRSGAAGGGDGVAVAEQLGALTAMFEAIDSGLASEGAAGDAFAGLSAAMVGEAERYFETPNGRLVFLRVTPAKRTGFGDEVWLAEVVSDVRSVMAEMAAEHAGFEMGLTGIDVVETDETAAAERDSTRASIVAAVLIATVLVLAFWSFRTPALLLVALGVAMAWSFGYLTLAIGHLQVISVVFAVILLGLGVDFGIHLLSRFERVRHDHPDGPMGFAATLRDTLEVAGPGVVTGALTTAAAMSTTVLTEFRGVAEMGHIAAVGVLLCLLSMLTVLPALLRLLRHATGKVKPMGDRKVHVYAEGWSRAASSRPWLTLSLVAGVLLVAGFGVGQVRYSFDLNALMPRGVDSVEWAQRIERDGAQSIYFGVSVVGSMEEARELGRRYMALETVERLGGVGLAIPREGEAKAERLAEVAAGLPSAAEGVADSALSADALRASVARWGPLLALAEFGVPAEGRAALGEARAAVGGVLARLSALPEAERGVRVAALQAGYAAWRAGVVELIEEATGGGAIELADLPEAITRPYVATWDGRTRLALEVYPRLPAGVATPLDPAFLDRFVEDLRAVDPEATGVIVQIYESNALIVRSYVLAGVLALAAVAVILWIDFRRLDDALLCMVPTLVGFWLTFGVMGWIGDPIDPANIIVLPLLFGIGVDAGVHLMHRYRQEPTARPLGLASGTGKGIALTSYTTIIGFGALMTASHRGIAGLGFVMSLGILLTLGACCYVLPAILEVRQRRLGDVPA